MKIVGWVLGALIVVGLLLWALRPGGARLKDWEALREPKLRAQSDLTMLVVEAQGDPAQTSQQAFGQLFGEQSSWFWPTGFWERCCISQGMNRESKIKE